LGQALTAVLPPAGYDLRAALDRAGCDIADADAVRAVVDKHAPDVIFNAAAYTDVDRAEAEPDAAYRANAVAAETLARAADAAGAVLVHYSTDFAYDGERERAYDEFDPPSPQGLYARSKVAGEQLAAAATRRLFTAGATSRQRSCAACAPARPCARIAIGSGRRPGSSRSRACRRRWRAHRTLASTTARRRARRAGRRSPASWRRSWACPPAASSRCPRRRCR
jgi:nucleoside-diphosphate-sugar epimerase